MIRFVYRYYAEIFFTLAARSVPSVINDVAIPALRSPDVKPAVASSVSSFLFSLTVCPY